MRCNAAAAARTLHTKTINTDGRAAFGRRQVIRTTVIARIDRQIRFDITFLYTKLECGPMPNVMAALPNTDGALCSTPQSLADAHY